MSDYVKDREAWLNNNCHADSPVARGLLKKGADWGREYESRKLNLAQVRLLRTKSACYHALLEMSAWLGIPEKKRMNIIRDLMENVTFCADVDVTDNGMRIGGEK